jgi:uncharacterized membrane protein
MTARIFESFLKQLDLALTLLFTVLCVLFVFIPPLNQTPIRIVLSLPLVLFLPGYSLIGVLFPRKNDLSGIERAALSFVLSLAIVPLLGLVLNYTPFGIRLEPVLFVLSAFTISLSLVAWVRRMKVPAEERFRVPFERLLKVNLGQSALDKGLSIALIASIIGSSATLVYVAVTPKTGERFTEFYILGPNGTASDYPTDLKVGEEGKVIIGIINHEYENVTYRLEVNFNGSLIHKEQVFLIENETWESSFTFKATDKGENQKLEFLIYKDQQTEAYRTLHLWINVT